MQCQRARRRNFSSCDLLYIASCKLAHLIFRFRNVLGEIFFAAAQRGHETDAIFLFHHACPTLLIDIMPPGKFPRLSRRRRPRIGAMTWSKSFPALENTVS